MSRTRTLGLPRTCLALLLAASTSVQTRAETGTVRLHESAYHGFLVLRDEAGATVGSGEVVQAPHKGHMSVRLIFRFKDGSIDDETTEYSQDGTFHLISDRHIQRGHFFPHPIESSIDVSTQQVKTVQLDKGPQSASSDHMDLPPDLSNGIVLTLVKNFQSYGLEAGKEKVVSYFAFSPKARLVKLAISNIGEQSFKIAGHAFPANHYLIKIDLGGITGVVAPLVGKQPATSMSGPRPAEYRPLFVWILHCTSAVPSSAFSSPIQPGRPLRVDCHLIRPHYRSMLILSRPK